MKPEVKKLWIDSLCSGEYKQGTGALHDNMEDTYCCLGVLCQLAVNAGADVSVQEVGAVTEYNETGAYPPPPVVAWAGLSQPDPVVYIGAQQKTLAALNDEGQTFEEIANIIEEQL